jgi:2-polyprenyl-3-methyl-5-hydroxy-6-metoxy-1,4-benzoquinol methylase
MKEYRYEGQELNVFALANHWKLYFNSILKNYIGKKVAEVGAGHGATTSVLCNGNQDTWLCIEPDEEFRMQIDKKIASGQLPSCCHTSGVLIHDLDPGEQFDTILYIDVLEHIQNDAVEINVASQHIVLGGTLIVLSPAYPILFSEFDNSIGHFRRYTKKSLLALTPSGFIVERVYFLDSIGFWISLANRIFVKQSKPNKNQILFWDNLLLPISRFVDRLIGYHFGRSIVVIWRCMKVD